jgi:hypothetical protein
VKEQKREAGNVPPPPTKKRYHFLEVYADRGTTGAVPTVR